MQLASAGKVNLDAPVRRYIPWFKVGDGRESDMITVRQLLDQTSGISNKAGLTELSFASSTTFTQAINGFEAFPLSSPPGQKFQYSDANCTIAGYIVQQVSGQSYDSYVQQHIFAPLGMTHTYAIISSAADVTHYLTAEMNGGVYNGTRVLPAQAMHETHAPLAGRFPATAAGQDRQNSQERMSLCRKRRKASASRTTA